jgi:CHAT domain-containing protein
LVLTAGAQAPPRLIDLGEADAIDETVAQVRQSVIYAGSELAKTDKSGLPEAERTWEEGFRQVSRPLYQRVFAPLRAALGPATLIYLAPDGELNRLPFEALVDDQGRYLIETYRFAYLSSGRDLLQAHPQPGQGTVVFAGPDYNLGAARRHEAAEPLLAALSRGTPPGWRGARSGDVRGLPRWGPLAGAAQEADLVQQALQGSGYGPVTEYVGPKALEEVLKRLRAPRVLHLATHGFFLPDEKRAPEDRGGPFAAGLEFGPARVLVRLRGTENPLLRSGLVLAGANAVGERAGPATAPGQQADAEPAVDDGWVTAEEIALMDLRGTELVVLSACETGLGSVKIGEGVYGLRRAFLYAGARTLVTSLFAVPDEQTHQLMQRFYGALKAGQGKLEALHGAQVELLRQRRAAGGAAHPFFWASFVLVGDPE